MTLNGVMALFFCVISANSGSFRVHCVKVHVRYLISWRVLVVIRCKWIPSTSIMTMATQATQQRWNKLSSSRLYFNRFMSAEHHACSCTDFDLKCYIIVITAGSAGASDTIRYIIFTCAQKMTNSQLNLPHGTKQKVMKKLKTNK